MARGRKKEGWWWEIGRQEDIDWEAQNGREKKWASERAKKSCWERRREEATEKWMKIDRTFKRHSQQCAQHTHRTSPYFPTHWHGKQHGNRIEWNFKSKRGCELSKSAVKKDDCSSTVGKYSFSTHTKKPNKSNNFKCMWIVNVAPNQKHFSFLFWLCWKNTLYGCLVQFFRFR